LNGTLRYEGPKMSDVSMCFDLQNRKRHARGWPATPPPMVKSDVAFLVSQKRERERERERENIINASTRLGVTHL